MTVGCRTLCHIIVNGRCWEAVRWVQWNDDFTAHGLLSGCCDGMTAEILAGPDQIWQVILATYRHLLPG